MNGSTRRVPLLLLAAALPLALAMAACSDDDDVNSVPRPSLTVNDQVVDPADVVVVRTVRSVGPGWVVIHEDDGGAPGTILGHVSVADGLDEDVTVLLDRELADGETVWAMLHVDAGVVGTFEFPGVDVPAMRDGEVVQADFTVTVPPPEPGLTVTDQTLDTVTTLLTIDGAFSVGPGWLVVHEDDGGSPGAVIGHAAVVDGENLDVVVPLDRPARDDETLWAMLHVDAGAIGTYEFPGPDVPATDNGGQVVTAPLQIVVAPGTPAAVISVDNQLNNAYVMTAYPDHLEIVGPADLNPTLTLHEGWRYAVDNVDATLHPFELVEAGATPAADTVLLSQAVLGDMEGDTAVDWEEIGDVIRFTVSAGLAARLDAYRCSSHPSTMRGQVLIAP